MQVNCSGLFALREQSLIHFILSCKISTVAVPKSIATTMMVKLRTDRLFRLIRLFLTDHLCSRAKPIISRPDQRLTAAVGSPIDA